MLLFVMLVMREELERKNRQRVDSVGGGGGVRVPTSLYWLQVRLSLL